MKKSILTFSVVTLLSATSSLAFSDSEKFSFGNRLVDAADQGNVEIVEAILANGEDPNIPGKFETSALHRAAYNGNVEIMNLLIKSGADVNFQDYGGATPLHIAARTGKNSAAEGLLEKGADINTIDGQGYTPLHRAISNNQMPVSIMLIQRGAEVNTANNEGNTPLIDAVKISNPEMVKALLVNGADKTLKNNRGLDAIDFALKAGNKKIDTMLSRSIQDLMKDSPVSSQTVVASSEPVKPVNLTSASSFKVEDKPIPAFLMQEAEMQNKIAEATPFVKQGAGTEYIQSVKVPVADVQEEVIDKPPLIAQANEPEPIQQVQERYQFAEIEEKKYQDPAPEIAEEKSLEKTPRLPDDGKLPRSLRADFLEIQQRQQQQEQLASAQAEAQKNMPAITLPKNSAEIENNVVNIALPEPELQQLKPEAVSEQPKILIPQEQIAQVPEKPTVQPQVQVAQAKVNYQQIETYSDVPASTYVTSPVDSIQVISNQQPVVQKTVQPEPAQQEAVPVVQTVQPAFDRNYAAEVDAIMQNYIVTEYNGVDQSYSSEVDSIMNQAISGMEGAPQPQTKFQPPAFPASLTLSQAKKMNLSADTSSYIQQNIQPTNFTAMPAYTTTAKTIEENIMPAVPTADVIEESSELPAPQAVSAKNETTTIMKKSRNSGYDSYRSSLIQDINEFYNKDYQGFNSYDISDLDRQRTNTLGLQAAEQKAISKVNENATIVTTPASEKAPTKTSDDIFDSSGEPEANYDSANDNIPEAPADVKIEEIEKLSVPEEALDAPVITTEEKPEEKKTEEGTEKSIDIDIPEDLSIKDLPVPLPAPTKN